MVNSTVIDISEYQFNTVQDWWFSYSPVLFSSIAQANLHQNFLEIHHGACELNSNNLIFVGEFASFMTNVMQDFGYTVQVTDHTGPWKMVISWE